MTDRVPAEVFPPGEFIKEELEARNWTQNDLAEILDVSPRLVSEIITGKRSITPNTAKRLADAFGTSAQLWMNLDSAYQLWKVPSHDDAVLRRSKLYKKAPVSAMTRRHWIEPSGSIAVLEKRVNEFLHLESPAQTPSFWQHAARRSTTAKASTPAQIAWLYRCKQLAQVIETIPFSNASFRAGLDKLTLVKHAAEEIRHIPRILAESGIRFVIVEHLPQTHIDGVCFWLDKQSPVVALSFRYDRIDWFWFTLMHELGHVKHKDGLRDEGDIDTDLVGKNALPTDQKSKSEQRADMFAAEFLVRPEEIENFITRVSPLYSKKKIKGFAARIKVHPGIVVGQLQRRKQISYAHNREMLVKVRDSIVDSALTDGWGHQIAADF